MHIVAYNMHSLSQHIVGAFEVLLKNLDNDINNNNNLLHLFYEPEKKK